MDKLTFKGQMYTGFIILNLKIVKLWEGNRCSYLVTKEITYKGKYFHIGKRILENSEVMEWLGEED